MSALREVLTRLGDAREALLTAEVAQPERSAPALEDAVEELGRLKTLLAAELTRLSPSEIAELKRHLRAATALAAQAGSFYLRCTLILESLTRVYTPEGVAKAMTAKPSLSVEG